MCISTFYTYEHLLCRLVDIDATLPSYTAVNFYTL